MTDNSKIVLCWVIDNAAARFATGKVVSELFDEGGFKWSECYLHIPSVRDIPSLGISLPHRTTTRGSVLVNGRVSIAGVEQRGDQSNDECHFTLRCDSDHNRDWKCDAEVNVHVLHRDSRSVPWGAKGRFCFSDNNRSSLYNTDGWAEITDNAFMVNDKVTVEFHIHVISLNSGKPIADVAMFAAPNNRSDVILKIGNEKLHVSKEYLAVHSPVFETLFFGDFAEKGKEEVEIKDVVYEDFLDLLHLLYYHTMVITDRTVPHILKLADQFQMERFIEHSEKHLIQSKGFDVAKKLSFADQYRLVSLKDHCFKSFTNAADMIAKLKSSPEYDKFSGNMKIAISDRIMKF